MQPDYYSLVKWGYRMVPHIKVAFAVKGHVEGIWSGSAVALEKG